MHFVPIQVSLAASNSRQRLRPFLPCSMPRPPSCPHQILFLQATVLCSSTVKSTVASGHCSSPATGIYQKIILHCTKWPAQCWWPFSCPLAPVGEACANQVQLGGQFLWEPVCLSDSYRTQTAPVQTRQVIEELDNNVPESEPVPNHN